MQQLDVMDIGEDAEQMIDEYFEGAMIRFDCLVS